jgi:predicted RND superfamily exporter protein
LLLRLEGDETLVVKVETKRLETPAGLRVVRALEDFIVAHGELTVGGALGPPDYIATTNAIMMRSIEARRVPDEPRLVPVLWRHYGRVRGEHFVYRVVTDDRSRGLVTVYLKNANYRDTRTLMQAIREYEREHLEPQGIRLTFAGDVAVSQALIGAIVQTQTQSILLSLLGILAIGVLFTRSLRYGFFIVLPCSVAVLLNFAFMGWTGMPLGVATSMFAAMILGTGVDFAIHLVERYRRERSAGSDVETALVAAAATCGPPILIDSAAMALGFGILTLSQVPANARLGAIAVLCIVTCLLATLVLLPAIMRAWVGRSRT